MQVFSRLKGIIFEVDLCTGVATYYYLFGRYDMRSRKQELARCCPGCGGTWRLEEPYHLIDFRCDRRRLMSHIAWSVR